MLQQRANELNSMVSASDHRGAHVDARTGINVRLIAKDDQLAPLVSELLVASQGGDAERKESCCSPKSWNTIRDRLRPRVELSAATPDSCSFRRMASCWRRTKIRLSASR